MSLTYSSSVAKSANSPVSPAAPGLPIIFARQAFTFWPSSVISFTPFIAHPDSISVQGGGSQEVLMYVMKASAPLILGVMFAAAIAGAAGNLVQTGLMFTPSKVFKFDYKKISPMAGLKRMFVWP